MTKNKASPRDKTLEIYRRLKEEFYLCREDLEVAGERFNSALLCGTLTEINKGNQILFGEYGSGKTTSAEYLNAVFNNLPLELVRIVSLRGNPQLTEEKMVGRPDYGKMHKGEESVVWQDFVLVGPKIFDEFNRIPESNQSVVLDGLDRGNWSYLNSFISTGKQPFFATCNYADRGNNQLIPPILDRFDIAVEAKFPGTANAIHIAKSYGNENDKLLCNPEATKLALEVLASEEPYNEKKKKLEDIANKHRKILEKNGFPTISADELREAEKEIKAIPFNKDAEKYFSFLVAELNVAPKFGQKRSTDPAVTDNGLYLGALLKGSGSRRKEKSLWRYSQSLAWIQNKKVVNVEHVGQIAPYVLWHRMPWTDETIEKFSEDKRDDPLELYITKTLVNEGTSQIPGVKKRFAESRQNYQEILNLAGNSHNKEAIEKAKKFNMNEKGHPIFLDIIKDIEE